MPVIADKNLGIGPKTWQYGVLYACFGLGAALGAVSVGTVFARVSKAGGCSACVLRVRDDARGVRADPVGGSTAYPGGSAPRLRVLRRDHLAVDTHPIAPRRRRTRASDGAVDHGLRRHGSRRRARSGDGSAMPPVDHRGAPGPRFGQSCSPRGRMRSLSEPREPPMSECHARSPTARCGRASDVIRQASTPSRRRRAPPPPVACIDVLAHLVGVPDDVVNGRMDSLASDSWTQAQVDMRASFSARRPARRVGEPPARGSKLCSAARASGDRIGQALFDAAAHEHDVLYAIERAELGRATRTP